MRCSSISTPGDLVVETICGSTIDPDWRLKHKFSLGHIWDTDCDNQLFADILQFYTETKLRHFYHCRSGECHQRTFYIESYISNLVNHLDILR